MKTLWRWWKALARKIGNAQARLLLTVFYFSVAVPFGAGARWFSDPLRIKQGRNPTAWLPREPRSTDPAELQRHS